VYYRVLTEILHGQETIAACSRGAQVEARTNPCQPLSATAPLYRQLRGHA